MKSAEPRPEAAPEGTLIARVENRLAAGFFFEALDAAERGIAAHPESLRLAQLRALSLARLGRTERARDNLQRLFDAGNRDAETIGILARVYKDIYRHGGDVEAARHSRDLYREGYALTSNPYPGINAAAMSLILGDTTMAHDLAVRLLGALPEKTSDLWTAATRGEACLITGDHAGARIAYGLARDLAASRPGLLSSMYQQILLLAAHASVPNDLPGLIAPPPVVFFTGHMIDRPGREQPRFPDAISDAIKTAVAAAIGEIAPARGFSSAACGADLLFIEAMDQAGAEVSVYLPFAMDDFMATSVSPAGPAWIERFHAATHGRTLRYVTEERHFGDDGLFRFLGEVLMGLTLLTAELLAAEAWFLGVLDDETERRPGGSTDLADRWPNRQTMRVVRPADFRSALPITLVEAQSIPDAPTLPGGISREVRAILFADIVGYSRLTEEETPFFMFDLLGRLADVIDRLGGKPQVLNTWGDAVFALFIEPAEAAEFALALRSLFSGKARVPGSPAPDMDIRIALHAGPVFVGSDPLTGRDNAYGSHVNRAARMEPVTIPGCVYVSEQFAALLRTQTARRYRYTYVGTLELPKGFGRQEMYELTAGETSSS